MVHGGTGAFCVAEHGWFAMGCCMSRPETGADRKPTLRGFGCQCAEMHRRCAQTGKFVHGSASLMYSVEEQHDLQCSQNEAEDAVVLIVGLQRVRRS